MFPCYQRSNYSTWYWIVFSFLVFHFKIFENSMNYKFCILASTASIDSGNSITRSANSRLSVPKGEAVIFGASSERILRERELHSLTIPLLPQDSNLVLPNAMQRHLLRALPRASFPFSLKVLFLIF